MKNIKPKSPPKKISLWLLAFGFWLVSVQSVFSQSDKKLIRDGNELFEKKKFSDAEVAYKKSLNKNQKSYESHVVIKLNQSSQRQLLLCRGQGLEPHIELDRPLVEFGPILPHSAGDDKDIVIRNPCKFDIEIYSLEFDKAYLEEEKVSFILLIISMICLASSLTIASNFIV